VFKSNPPRWPRLAQAGFSHFSVKHPAALLLRFDGKGGA
jgi:hypothetical protein